MKSFNTYLTFNGNCREAMEYYANCLGGKLEVMPFTDAPGCEVPESAKNMVMHACLTNGPIMLMASDNMPGMEFQQGNNFSLNISCETEQEQDRLFDAIGKGGKVTIALHDAFWGARFGMLTDQFGINWMFNCEKAAAHA